MIGSLAATGFAAAVLDWHGHGRSRPSHDRSRRCHVDDYKTYLHDVTDFLSLLTQRLPPPYFALCQSMGGLIWLHHARRSRPLFAAAVLLAPMVDLPLQAAPRRFVRLGAKGMSQLGAGRWYLPGQSDPRLLPYDGNPYTSCAAGYAALVALVARHADLAIGGVTFGWLDATFAAIDSLNDAPDLERLAIPVLVVQAGSDTSVCNRAQERLAKRLPMVRLQRFASARHALLWERPAVKDAVLADIASFYHYHGRHAAAA